MEEKIRDLFYQTYRGSSNIKNKLQNEKVDEKQINKVLNNQEIYQLMKKPRKMKHYYPLSASYENERHQLDLMDIGSTMNKYPVQKNKGYRYVMCLIDVYTRKAYTYPLKTKGDEEVSKAFLILIEKAGEPPFQLDCDNEGSFTSRRFKKICEDYNIHINFVKPNDINSKAVVERFNQTLRRMLVLYMLHKGEKVWYDALEWLTDIYNNSYNSGIKQTPNDINEKERMTDISMKKDLAKKYQSFLKIGDKVRILLKKNLGDKKTDVNWTRTVHTIVQINGNNIFVSERKQPYKANEVQVVSKVENEVEPNKEDEEYENERRFNLRLKKVGVSQNNIVDGKRSRKKREIMDA